jgi:pectate lyase
LLRVLKGSRFFDNGSTHNGLALDLLAALRTTHPGVNWVADVGWAPGLFLAMDSVADVPARVRAGAGAGREKAD